jgi:NADH:ubiquinone oxidoreductase subunit K
LLTLTLEHYLLLGAILFSIGLYGALARRNAVAVLMSIELMFNGVNVTLIGMASS